MSKLESHADFTEQRLPVEFYGKTLVLKYDDISPELKIPGKENFGVFLRSENGELTPLHGVSALKIEFSQAPLPLVTMSFVGG